MEAAIQKLGYVPNAVARTLTTRRSGIIGCLLVENLSNPHQYIVDALAMQLLLRRMAQPDAPTETCMIDLHEVDRGTVQQRIPK